MERFWSKVEKSDGCWLWMAACFQEAGTRRKTYGMFALDHKLQPAHRVSWMFVHGPIPPGLWVLHTCDTKRCVRPDHLYLGTHADNTRDAIERHRMHHGEAMWNARLHDEDIPRIRGLAASGMATEKIGPLFGVSGRTIRFVLEGRRWRHVHD